MDRRGQMLSCRAWAEWLPHTTITFNNFAIWLVHWFPMYAEFCLSSTLDVIASNGEIMTLTKNGQRNRFLLSDDSVLHSHTGVASCVTWLDVHHIQFSQRLLPLHINPTHASAAHRGRSGSHRLPPSPPLPPSSSSKSPQSRRGVVHKFDNTPRLGWGEKLLYALYKHGRVGFANVT